MIKTFTPEQTFTVRLNTLQLVRLAHAEAARIRKNSDEFRDTFRRLADVDLPRPPKPRIRIVSPTEVTLEILLP